MRFFYCLFNLNYSLYIVSFVLITLSQTGCSSQVNTNKETMRLYQGVENGEIPEALERSCENQGGKMVWGGTDNEDICTVMKRNTGPGKMYKENEYTKMCNNRNSQLHINTGANGCKTMAYDEKTENGVKSIRYYPSNIGGINIPASTSREKRYNFLVQYLCSKKE